MRMLKSLPPILGVLLPKVVMLLLRRGMRVILLTLLLKIAAS